METFPIFRYLNLKLASTCNLKCVYCYWFRDKTVYDKPPILTTEAEIALLEKLKIHINKYNITRFSILFHGGEPLLFNKQRFVRFMDSLRLIQQKTGCKFDLSITTNGTLIDEEWAQIIDTFHIDPTISIDGPSEIHDILRPDLGGHGSLTRTIHGLNLLRDKGIDPAILAVCNVNTDPEEIVHYFVDILSIRRFDILLPDATHEDKPQSIATYYKKLFDLWYDNYSGRGTVIRHPKLMLKSLLGGKNELEGIGYGPIQTIIMLTDGTLEPLDVLRIAGNGSTHTNINIKAHTFQDITFDPVWLEAYYSSINLCDTCKSCEYQNACGGGYLPHRWSKQNRYDNVSVYCEDIKDIFVHIKERIGPEIEILLKNKNVDTSCHT